jgi:hypothetical protein
VRDRARCHELHKKWEILRHKCEHHDSAGNSLIGPHGQCAACLNHTNNEGF